MLSITIITAIVIIIIIFIIMIMYSPWRLTISKCLLKMRKWQIHLSRYCLCFLVHCNHLLVLTEMLNSLPSSTMCFDFTRVSEFHLMVAPSRNSFKMFILNYCNHGKGFILKLRNYCLPQYIYTRILIINNSFFLWHSSLLVIAFKQQIQV